MGSCRIRLLIVVALLFALGFSMIFGTSSAEVIDHSLTIGTHHALVRHIFSAAVGCLLAGFCWLIGYRSLLQLSGPLLGFCTLLLACTFLPGIGLSVNGANRWIGFSGYTFQPSEFVKLLVPAYFIHEVLQFEGNINLPKFLRLLLKISVPMLLIMLEPDNGTTAIIGLTLIALCFLTKIPARYWVLPMVAMSLVAGVAAWNLPYVQSRLKVYLDPELDVRGRGHQPLQARIAAGSGGLLGKGPGRSLQKLSYLPEAQNDYIAAIYAEEFGFAGVFLLVTLYMSMAYLGFRIALQTRTPEGALLAASLTFLVAIQAFLNLGVVSGLLPSTGLNLPFFSQGGTSLMANSMAIGLILNVARHSEKEHELRECSTR